MNHYNMFAHFEDMNNPQVIPDSWYRYTRQEVDTGTHTQKTIGQDWSRTLG